VESVRVAVDHDRDRLIELGRELVAAMAAQRGGPMLMGPTLDEPDGAEVGQQVSDLMGRPDALVMVGALDEVVVAFAVSTVEEDPRGVRRGRFGACFVEEGARGVGVGRLLLDGSLTWLEEQGCDGVDGVALPGDRGAKTFYESAGFKARLLTMHRELGPMDGADPA
jgi:GNAT superfamily N-acetyltransferase